MRSQQKKIREWTEAIALAMIITSILKIFVLDVIQVEGYSMTPTLNDKDRLLINKIVYIFNKPQKGDVIIFQYPSDKGVSFIKRVIATEGDIVEISDGHVYVNCERIEEPYLLETTRDDFKQRMVPKDTIFVLGDNRNNSKDSRFKDIGPVATKLAKGKACIKIWPLNQFAKIY